MRLSANIRKAFVQYANASLDEKKPFVIDEENKAALDRAITLFINDQGIYFKGNPGSGKTFIMEVFQRITLPHEPNHFLMVDAFQMVKTYNEHYAYAGDKTLSHWDNKNICLNELGLEEAGVYQSEVMMKFILFRHRLWVRTGRKTHFTTNLTDSQLDQRYTSAVRRRMYEMSEEIILGGKAASIDRSRYRNFKAFPKVIHERRKEKAQ